MRIRRLEIERFRGIKNLDWKLGDDFVCLLGPGDSTKTTILDAIEFALSPRWNLQFDDTDFYDAQTIEPIRITVTIGDLPEKLKSEQRYGYLARGWSSGGELHDEPEEDDELVLSIQLRIEPSLELSWLVINDRNPEGKAISANDRELLGCARLGDFLDRHFSWGRGSILSRLTGEADSLSGILADAGRAARAALEGFEGEEVSKLHSAAEKAKIAGAKMGVAVRSEYRPHLDVQAVSVGIGGLSLHDGQVPLRRGGLGTRRLLAIAMQREIAKAGGVTLIDEVEHGLEPHRIRRLLQVLRGTGDPQDRRHVLMTTHAPVVLEELQASELRVVRSSGGETEVLQVRPQLQPVIRKASEAFLARKVLVCEGKTELGFCRRLDEWWASNYSCSFGHSGVALAHGGGSEAAGVTKAFADLGYPVALLGDSDQPLDPDQVTLEGSGARVLLWSDGVSLEERVALDLPWEGIVAVVNLAINLWSEESIRQSVASKLPVDSSLLSRAATQWLEVANEAELRKAIGVAAKEYKGGKGWFKRVDLAEDLAGIVIEHYEAIRGKDLGQKIDALRAWVHGDG